MAIDQIDRTLVTRESTPTGGQEGVETDSRRPTRWTSAAPSSSSGSSPAG